jgi:hypothetical protein
MWLRRLSRWRRTPSPLDPSALDRLEELIARVIELVPEAAGARQPTAPPVLPSPEPEPEPEPEPARPAPAAERPAAAHLLLLPGYTLHERPGPAPARGSGVEHEGVRYTVLRHGPSPFPSDPRQCAILERA